MSANEHLWCIIRSEGIVTNSWWVCFGLVGDGYGLDGETTYGESDGAGMGGEILLDRTGNPELVGGSDHPESHRRITADPAVNLVVLVLC